VAGACSAFRVFISGLPILLPNGRSLKKKWGYSHVCMATIMQSNRFYPRIDEWTIHQKETSADYTYQLLHKQHVHFIRYALIHNNQPTLLLLLLLHAHASTSASFSPLFQHKTLNASCYSEWTMHKVNMQSPDLLQHYCILV
jgi:hypothetical protein